MQEGRDLRRRGARHGCVVVAADPGLWPMIGSACCRCSADTLMERNRAPAGTRSGRWGRALPTPRLAATPRGPWPTPPTSQAHTLGSVGRGQRAHKLVAVAEDGPAAGALEHQRCGRGTGERWVERASSGRQAAAAGGGGGGEPAAPASAARSGCATTCTQFLHALTAVHGQVEGGDGAGHGGAQAHSSLRLLIGQWPMALRRSKDAREGGDADRGTGHAVFAPCTQLCAVL